MARQALALSFAFIVPAVAAAQMRFFYPAPPAASIEALLDRAYGSTAATDLRMDVFRPAKAPRPLPALIFFNMATGAQRTNPFYKAWAEIAASKNLVAILPDLRNERFEADLNELLAHLSTNAAALGIDRERIALYAGSGNVSRALPLVQNPKQTAIKAAIVYYGAAQVTAFRRDLPMLVVRAGLDRPPLNRALSDLAAVAITQNAPLTFVNYAGGYHAFEIFNDEEATREIIDRTTDFAHRATEPGYQASLRRGVPEAAAAAHVAAGSFAEAATAYADLVKSRPDDPRLRLAYGEALLGASRFADACAELSTLKGKGLGPRDLGVPAARACMQSGDGDAALAWLATIPQRFLPRDLEKDPIFAPIQSRPAFRALFEEKR